MVKKIIIIHQFTLKLSIMDYGINSIHYASDLQTS